MAGNNRPVRISIPAAAVIIFAGALVLLLTVFFETHFYPGTVINGIMVSCLTVEDADKKMNSKAASYTLLLNERGNIKEWIKGSDIGLKFGGVSGCGFYKNLQNRTFWMVSFFQHSSLEFGTAYQYDEILLKNRFDSLACTDKSKIIEPNNAGLLYSNGFYHVVKEVYGNKVNEELLYGYIKHAVKNGKTKIDLEGLNCYLNPAIKSDSAKLWDTKKAADRYVASKVTYTHTGDPVVADGDEISSWIEFDHELNIAFNEAKMAAFLNSLADRFNTSGRERDFLTSSGKRIKIGGGDYGWKVDIKKEKIQLIQDVMSGTTVEREPLYSQKGALPGINDIGSTYVEIDLTRQQLWYYHGGILIAQGAVVSGNMSKGYKTPDGIYSLKYKVRDAVLKGENYRTSVSYWMPFNHDIGIHDAPWRTDFGRDIYLTRGSHGCINVPFYLAETIFNHINVDTPVVCYY